MLALFLIIFIVFFSTYIINSLIYKFWYIYIYIYIHIYIYLIVSYRSTWLLANYLLFEWLLRFGIIEHWIRKSMKFVVSTSTSWWTTVSRNSNIFFASLHPFHGYFLPLSCISFFCHWRSSSAFERMKDKRKIKIVAMLVKRIVSRFIKLFSFSSFINFHSSS